MTISEGYKMIWRCLETDPPTGDHPVLLFPCRTDCGILYITSNPVYARVNAFKNGYTHWAEIELAPDHDKWTRWQAELIQEEIQESINGAIKTLEGYKE